MHGMTVIVTGAGAGIGLETADALAQKGAALILIELNSRHGAAALRRLEGYEVAPRLFLADLSSLAEVRRVAGEILTSVPRIDALINNAGALFLTRQVTADGLERTFALNHMGYFVLTYLLLERIVDSAPARIVSVSSAAHAHDRTALDFDDLQSERNYSGQSVYNRSKLANILFTRELARRLRGTGVTANCLHPGTVASQFFESAGGQLREMARAQRELLLTPSEGARTSVYLASSPEVASTTGQYFKECKVARASEGACDDAAAERLWTESLRLAGLR